MDSEVVRGKPLTKDETKFLLGLIERSPIILSKMTISASNKMKTEEWVRLTRKFNATATVCRRTPQQLRLKWENLKELACERSTKIRMNCIQTGGGIPEYIPPDDILDRVADLLGSTASGFVVPFGGDKEEGVFVCSGGGGDGVLVGQAKVLPLESIPVSVETGIDGLAAGQSPILTPKRLTLSMSRIGKKKLKTSDDSGSVRNLAIAEYYTAKKQLLDVKKEHILLHNEKLKLEIEKLRNN